MWSRVCTWLFVLCGAGLGLGALALGYLWFSYHAPTGRVAALRHVYLAPGTSVRQMARTLQEAGVIRDERLFVLYAMATRKASRLQAGEYALRPTLSPAEILATLHQGRVVQHALTIPEGATVRDIARLAAAQGVGTPQAIVDLAQDAAFIASLQLDVTSLEGYLFPETYHIPRGMDARALLALMVRTLRQHYTADIAARGGQLGMPPHDVLTMASLIEKEAQVDAERPLISAVFHNRLRKRMRLQCDSTVIYALAERFDGNLRKADLRYDSPYNTYRYAGLPPGPIANPGQRSLEAAVSPAAVDYLYFVATKQNGAHAFSRTLSEHNKAVRQYQLGR